jgi:hypothetical protein
MLSPESQKDDPMIPKPFNFIFFSETTGPVETNLG